MSLIVLVVFLQSSAIMSTYVHSSNDGLVPDSYTKRETRLLCTHAPGTIQINCISFANIISKDNSRQGFVFKRTPQVRNQINLWHVNVDQMLRSYLTGCPRNKPCQRIFLLCQSTQGVKQVLQTIAITMNWGNTMGPVVKIAKPCPTPIFIISQGNCASSLHSQDQAAKCTAWAGSTMRPCPMGTDRRIVCAAWAPA